MRKAEIDGMFGQQFGKLLVIDAIYTAQQKKRVRCQCSCGTETSLDPQSVLMGYVITCEHCHPSDLTGMRFGMIKVLSPSYRRTSRTDRMWLCQCDCGKQKRVRETRLKRGEARHCGCQQSKTGRTRTSKLPAGESNRNWIISKYKTSAREKNMECTLTIDDWDRLFKSNCFYCGKSPSNKAKATGSKAEFIYSGVDRLNNDSGYIPGNVVACCGRCNYAKRKMTIGEFMQWIITVAKHMNLVG